MNTSMQFTSEQSDTTNSLIKEIKCGVNKAKADCRGGRAAGESAYARRMEQYTRRNNVEVSGISVTTKENAINIGKDVETALGAAKVDRTSLLPTGYLR